MTLTADWSLEIAEREILAGQDIEGLVLLLDPRPEGFLGQKQVRTNDATPVGSGVAFGPDYYGKRVLKFGIAAFDDSAAAARVKYDEALAAWALGEEVRLDARLPGSPEAVMSYFGRCRDLEEIDSAYAEAELLTGLTFEADFRAYGEVRTESGLSGAVTLGAADMGRRRVLSSRATITVHGNGGTPSIVSTTNQGRDITFTGAVSGTVVLDLLMLTATQTTTDDVIGQIRSDSWWFELVGGVDNDLVISGCSGIDITWRPAYY